MTLLLWNNGVKVVYNGFKLAVTLAMKNLCSIYFFGFSKLVPSCSSERWTFILTWIEDATVMVNTIWLCQEQFRITWSGLGRPMEPNVLIWTSWWVGTWKFNIPRTLTGLEFMVLLLHVNHFKIIASDQDINNIYIFSCFLNGFFF